MGIVGKKRLVGILKNGMLCFVFQNACQKVTLNKVPFNVTQILEAGFYVQDNILRVGGSESKVK